MTEPTRPWWRDYRLAWLRGDLLAGFAVWAVMVPEGLAYATIAGIPPVAGLYAAIPALVLYALLGTSRQLVVGPMSATAALSASIVAGFAAAGGDRYVALTAALAIVTGLVGLLAWLLRMGFLATFISAPVLKGFIIGVALTIIVGQLPALFGVAKGGGNFFAKLADLVGQLSHINGWAVTVGALCLAVVVAFKHWVPVAPGSLIAVAIGVAAVTLLGLDARGVPVVGQIPSGLPRLGLPHGIGAADYLALVGPAAGLLLVGYAEGLGAAKTYAAKQGYGIGANRELAALGAANVGAGLAAGMVVNGSLSKTAVNAGAGARSQVSGLTVAVLTVVTLLFLTGLFENLPEAALAAVVIAAVVELVDFGALRRLYLMYTHRIGVIYGAAARADLVAAVVTLCGVLVLDTLPGLFIGIVVSVLLLLYRASRPYVAVLGRLGSAWVDTALHADARSDPDVAVVRVASGLFFANADHVHQCIREVAGGARTAVLDLAGTPYVDTTAALALSDLDSELRRSGRRLLIARQVHRMRDEWAARGDRTPLEVYPTIDAAVAAAGGAADHANRPVREDDGDEGGAPWER